LVVSATLLFVVAVYARAALFEFVYDDLGQIVYNPQIKSWMLSLTYFKSHVWAQSSTVALFYRPVFMLWLTANYKFFGLNPFYWHAVVIGLHLLCCVLLYFLVLRLTENKWVTVVAMLLFGLHPAHVESVAWVSGATDPLSAALLLGSLLCYLKHRDSGTPAVGWRWASLLLASLAVLAKESAIMIPAIIFSHQWIFSESERPKKAKLWSSLRAATPYLGISLLFLVARTLALHGLAPSRRGGLGAVLAWPQVVAFYGAHGLFPFRLSVFYNALWVSHPGLWNFVFPLVVISGGAAGLYYKARTSRLWAFFSVWCAIFLIPILNVTFWNNVENVHDRYLYLPSVGICVMLALALSRLKELHFASAVAATAVIAAGYGTVTVLEMPYWQDDYVLAQRGIAVSPGHPIASQLAGNILIRQQRVREAIPYLVDALNAQPDNVDTLCSIAFCYAELNALPLAEQSINRAIALEPAEPRAHLLLGIVRFKQKLLNEAEAEIRRGIELHRVSTGVLFHYYLGNVLEAKGDLQGAIREYRLEVLNDPAIDPAAATAEARIGELVGQLGVPPQQGGR